MSYFDIYESLVLGTGNQERLNTKLYNTIYNVVFPIMCKYRNVDSPDVLANDFIVKFTLDNKEKFYSKYDKLKNNPKDIIKYTKTSANNFCINLYRKNKKEKTLNILDDVSLYVANTSSNFIDYEREINDFLSDFDNEEQILIKASINSNYGREISEKTLDKEFIADKNLYRYVIDDIKGKENNIGKSENAIKCDYIRIFNRIKHKINMK